MMASDTVARIASAPAATLTTTGPTVALSVESLAAVESIAGYVSGPATSRTVCTAASRVAASSGVSRNGLASTSALLSQITPSAIASRSTSIRSPGRPPGSPQNRATCRSCCSWRLVVPSACAASSRPIPWCACRYGIATSSRATCCAEGLMVVPRSAGGQRRWRGAARLRRAAHLVPAPARRRRLRPLPRLGR